MIVLAPWLTPYPRLTGVLKGISRARLTTTCSVWNFRNSVLKTRYAHISGKAERDGRQAHTPRRQTTQTVHRLDARGGGGIQENYVGNDLLKKDNEKTIFYLKNLFDSEILPIFAARMRVLA